MNTRLMKGQKVLQGYLSAKNPVDTWVSGTFAIAFWTVNHLWHLGKYNLGLSSCLGEQGCVFRRILCGNSGGVRLSHGRHGIFHEMPFSWDPHLLGS